jgi:cytochrome c oxidase subunit 1
MSASASLGTTLKEWIFTCDHKRVGLLYLIGSMAAFVVAGLMAMLIRVELGSVGPTITDPNTYNVWLYFHGAAMILGFQIPALTGFFANYLVPLQIGAADVAFPRLNALSFWLFFSGIILALLTFVIPNPPDVMWTGYPPYSVISPGNTAFYTFTVLIMGFASIAGGVNLITTIIYMRAPGMTWGKLNMFVWCTLAAFILQLIFVPILGSAVTMVSLDKYMGTHFFSPGPGVNLRHSRHLRQEPHLQLQGCCIRRGRRDRAHQRRGLDTPPLYLWNAGLDKDRDDALHAPYKRPRRALCH